MKNIFITFILLFSIVTTCVAAEPFMLSSPQIKKGTLSNEQVYNSFGCTGKNISPELIWKNPPQGTKSFAITVFDPDAPTGSGWWHWIVYNIPASVSSLPTGASADAKKLPTEVVQGLNDFGFPGFGGACPPIGKKHRYVFTIYALSVDKLDLPITAMPAAIGFNIQMNMLGKASFTATYGRSQ